MPFNEQSIVEITVFGRSVSGQSMLNVYHYRQADTVPQGYNNASLVDAVNDFVGIWNTQIIPLVTDDYSVEKYRGRALTGTIANPTPPPPTVLVVGEQVEINAAPGTIGTRVGPSFPTYVAVGWQKLSSRAGRNFRGSSRLGTTSDGDATLNTWNAPYKTLLDANLQAFAVDTLGLDIAEIPWEMCIFSRTLALAAPPPFGLLRDLTAKVLGARVNPFTSSQVSRKQSLTSPT